MVSVCLWFVPVLDFLHARIVSPTSLGRLCRLHILATRTRCRSVRPEIRSPEEREVKPLWYKDLERNLTCKIIHFGIHILFILVYIQYSFWYMCDTLNFTFILFVVPYFQVSGDLKNPRNREIGK